MNRITFLDLIFSFFKVKDDDNSLKQSYDMALTTRRNIDWQAMYMNVIKTAESRYLPAPKWFLAKMKCFEIYEQGHLYGKKIRVFYKSGRITEYIIASDIETKLSNLISRFKDLDKVVKAELFDADVTFIGQNIFPNDAQFQVIYQAE